MNATTHRHEMRHKRQLYRLIGNAGQALLHFGKVPVAGYTVGSQALPRLGEQTAKLGLPASATDTGSAGGNQSTGFDHTCLE